MQNICIPSVIHYNRRNAKMEFNTETAIKLQALVRGRQARAKMSWPCALCDRQVPYNSMNKIWGRWRCKECTTGHWETDGEESYYVCPCGKENCHKACYYLECGCLNTSKGGYNCPALRAADVHYCGNIDCNGDCGRLRCGCMNKCKEGYDCPALRALGIHYCGDLDCTGDCGTLDCGCIDICRGRCGLRGWGAHHWLD
jgi:hypothetical protein